MTVEEIKKSGTIILECISGSKAQGLDGPNSDTDIKGVFVMPRADYYGLKYVEQVSNETNDIVYYELGRFMELLSLNNPNILELLYTPKDSVLIKHHLFEEIDRSKILSLQCKNSFGNFAFTQIKKAQGLNKKMMNVMPEERKILTDFCYVVNENGSTSLQDFLLGKGWSQEHCGLSRIPHMKDVFGLYYSTTAAFAGITKKENANEVCLSSIPKGMSREAILYVNQDAYSRHCKDYSAYWEWVKKRNSERYQLNLKHGNDYDSKNMMHVFRILEMAKEIGETGTVNVRRPNRDFLLDIKSGKYNFEELTAMAELRRTEMETAFEQSSLIESPDKEYIHQTTARMRMLLYESGIGSAKP